MKQINVKIEPGMRVRINPDEFDGEINAGKEFIVAGNQRDLCGTEVVALNNIDGSRFSAAYDISMLQIAKIKSTGEKLFNATLLSKRKYNPDFNSGFIAGMESVTPLLEEALEGLKAARENFIHDNDELIDNIEEVLKDE